MASKWSRRSPGTHTCFTACHANSCRVPVLALALLNDNSSEMSSSDKGRADR